MAYIVRIKWSNVQFLGLEIGRVRERKAKGQVRRTFGTFQASIGKKPTAYLYFNPYAGL